ncbi:hypothetical protein SAMN03080617_03674 [Algoriphagus alkaliphilus]|uniref:Uncharacterized protein n=1 Tax=Algoriphagus alkaliphilus TaxID=279824 RepID=A0A1G5ZF07_9BACT|nr:hypothetical protein [Algoriphagus alkaliphilus]SDA93050.1 hypothetical protein SAMN03080617_03674 [Algoriphagus alkaliphilus]
MEISEANKAAISQKMGVMNDLVVSVKRPINQQYENEIFAA